MNAPRPDADGEPVGPSPDSNQDTQRGGPKPRNRRRPIRGFFRALSGWGVIERAGKTATGDVGSSFASAGAGFARLLKHFRKALDDLKDVRSGDESIVDRFDRTPDVITVVDEEVSPLRPLLFRIRFAILIYSIAVAAGAAMLCHGAVNWLHEGRSFFTVLSHLIAGVGLCGLGWIKIADSAVDYALASGSGVGPFNTIRAMVRPLAWIPYPDNALFTLRVWPKVLITVLLDVTVFAYLYR